MREKGLYSGVPSVLIGLALVACASVVSDVVPKRITAAGVAFSSDPEPGGFWGNGYERRTITVSQTKASLSRAIETLSQHRVRGTNSPVDAATRGIAWGCTKAGEELVWIVGFGEMPPWPSGASSAGDRFTLVATLQGEIRYYSPGVVMPSQADTRWESFAAW